MTAKTVADIRARLGDLRRTKDRALADDATEFAAAKKALGLLDCSRKDAIEATKQSYTDRLANSWRLTEDFVNHTLTPKQTVPDDMHKSSEEWGNIQTRVDAASKSVGEDLHLDTWRGPGSTAYREHVNKQVTAMADLSKLAGANSELTMKVATLHEGIFEVIHDAFERANRDIRNHADYPAAVRNVTRDDLVNSRLVIYVRTQIVIAGLDWARSISRPYTDLLGRNYREAQSLVASLEQVAQSLELVNLETLNWPRPGGGPNSPRLV